MLVFEHSLCCIYAVFCFLYVTSIMHITSVLLYRMQTLPLSWNWLWGLARHLSYKKLMVWNPCFILCCVVTW